MNYSVIILAAGKGTRTNLDYNKVFYTFDDKETLIVKTLRPFLSDLDCKQVIMVIGENEQESFQQVIPKDERIVYIHGGATRQESVQQGLTLVKEERVMIQDGARCFLSPEEIKRCKEGLQSERACLLMVPAIDTIKVVENGYVVSTPKRATLYAAQTPQCFETALIKACYEQGRKEGWSASDDASLVERYSDVKVKVIQGEYTNKKVTTTQDLK